MTSPVANSVLSKDRRDTPRILVMREGLAFRPDGLAATVLIVDLSSGGARLRSRGQAVPNDFALVDPMTWLVHSATIMWRRDSEVGVKLMRSQSLRGQIGPALSPARRFCEAANAPGR